MALVALQQLVFPMPAGGALSGIMFGLITALVAVGMYLIYRATRVLNFAQAQYGVLPAVIVTFLITESGWPWLVAVALGLVGSALLGVLSEFFVIRRFYEAPRLIVTVATLGLGFTLSFLALLAPRWWDGRVTAIRVDSPIDLSFEIGPVVFGGNDVLVLIVGPLTLAGVGALMRYTSLGIAIRASAARPDRAAMLGVPVRALQSIVWGLASMLAFVAVMLSTGVSGLPVGGNTGLLLLLQALAALVIGRMVDLRAILAGALGLGVVTQGIFWNHDAAEADAYVATVTAAAIVLALLVPRAGSLRVDQEEAGAWEAVGQVRPLAEHLSAMAFTRWTQRILVGLAAGALLAVPALFGPLNTLRVAALLIFTVVLFSLVVLTGWAGQVSLGQGAFFGFGAAFGGWLTLTYDLDLILVLLATGVGGAVVAAIVGLPALRLRGMYLAVVTLALAMAATAYLLNPSFFDWVPGESDRIPRLPLLGRIDYDSPEGMYWVSLGFFVVVVAAVLGIRNSRTGRVLIALRENELSAAAFGVSVVRAKLSAFAISGFFASMAGGLFVHHQQLYQPGFYGAGAGIDYFIAGVIGGMGSLLGAFLGAFYYWGTWWWLEGLWRLMATGIGGLIILLIAPSGLSGLAYQLRDLLLRWLWQRRQPASAQPEQPVFPAGAAPSPDELAEAMVDAAETEHVG